jgi:hypothetical protein
MTTNLAKHLIEITGDHKGSRKHADLISVTDAYKAATATTAVANLFKYEAWTWTKTSDILTLHPLAIWKSLSLTIVPGPGIFGRSVTLHYGWRAEGETIPQNIEDMATLAGYNVHVFGGAGDPGASDRVIKAPFNSSRSDILKARSFSVGGRMVFYYVFVEANFGTTQVTGPRFFLKFDGEFDVYSEV